MDGSANQDGVQSVPPDKVFLTEDPYSSCGASVPGNPSVLIFKVKCD